MSSTIFGTGIADVVVIGGGINGAGVAYHLARRRAGRVLLLDIASPRAATPKSAAILACHYPSLPDSLLAHRGTAELAALAEETGGDTGLVRTGIVHLLPPGYAGDARRHVREQRAAGVDVEEITPAAAAELLGEGDFDDVGAAVLEPAAGYADPVRTTRLYRDEGRVNGVRVERCAVRRIRCSAGRVTGVETDAGVISAPVVVLAAGVWSAGLLATVGVDLGLAPRRVQISAFRVEPGAYHRRPVLIDAVRGSWIRPDTEDGVLAGLEFGVPVAGPADGDEGIDQWYVEMCRRKLAGRFPRLRDAAMRGGWAGLISMSPDGRPIIDRLAEADGLYCVAGDSGTSFKTAPAVARSLAEWIVDGRPSAADLRAFARVRPAAAPIGDGYGRFRSAARLSREIHRLQPTARSA
jgi:sarcosine oxidase, subunit beta